MTHNFSTTLGFDNLGIEDKFLLVLKRNMFTNPTPIQYQCIPKILDGKDIVGIAQTGTGKTLAFGLPMLQILEKENKQGLILVPTRELAIQASEMLSKLGTRAAVVIGGAPIYRQRAELRRRPRLIIATPGRLLDHIKRRSVNLKNIGIVVLDEADRMFDIGFLPDVKQILSTINMPRQTLLFSATMSPAIGEITSSFMRIPVRIEVAPSGTVAHGINQELFILKKEAKLLLLEKILSKNTGTILIFSRTRHATKKIKKAISEMGHKAAEIHSDRSLFQRKEAMAGFKSKKYRILVATDIAARGIDVSNISLVINYDLPENAEDYVHRIGRTGRAGSDGRAISFASPDQKNTVRKIEKLIKKKISISEIPKIVESGNAILHTTYFNKEREGRPFNSKRRSKFKPKYRNYRR